MGWVWSTTAYISKLNFDLELLKGAQSFKLLSTKITPLIIPEFFRRPLVCAPAVLLFNKPSSKTCRLCIFCSEDDLWSHKEGGTADCAVFWQIFSNKCKWVHSKSKLLWKIQDQTKTFKTYRLIHVLIKVYPIQADPTWPDSPFNRKRWEKGAYK